MSDTWHSTEDTPTPDCLHCEEGKRGGHYHCTEPAPCQDCTDDALTAAEDTAAGYGPDIDDDSYDRDSDLEHPWNLYA